MSGKHCENYDVKRETVHCYPRNVDRCCWNLSALFKICFRFVLLYNKSLNDWSLEEQWILFPSNLNVSLDFVSGNKIHCSPRDQSLSVYYHAIKKKLRHPGRALDLKTKDLIGYLWTSLFIDQSECLLYYLFLHSINSFLHCVKEKLHCSQPIKIE